MINKSYEFDPCSIDDSNDEEEITLDNWKPTHQQPKIIQSKWRKEQIGENLNQEPSLDDIKKISFYIKKKIPDVEIMQTFGINSDTLVAIKRHRYSPTEGISYDTFCEIPFGFARIEDEVSYLRRGLEYISKVLFIQEEDKKMFIQYCENKNKPKNSRKYKKK